MAVKRMSAPGLGCALGGETSLRRSINGSHAGAVELLRRARLEQAQVIGVQSDLLFSLSEQQAVARALEAAGVAAQFVSLPCMQGHDSFLIDLETFGREIGGFLGSG